MAFFTVFVDFVLVKVSSQVMVLVQVLNMGGYSSLDQNLRVQFMKGEPQNKIGFIHVKEGGGEGG